MDLDAAASLLKALAHPVRLTILRSLVDDERSVGAIEEATGLSQPRLSQQLAILRSAELVQTRREAKLVFYRIDRDRLAKVNSLIDAFAGTVAEPSTEADTVGRPRNGGAAVFAWIG